MKYLFTIIIFLLATFYLNAQMQGQEKIDSLLVALPKAKEDSNKVIILTSLANEYYSINPDEGIKYGEQSMSLAEKLNWKKGIALASNSLGVCYRIKSDYPKALEYHFKALKINEELDNKNGIATNLANIGIDYWNQSDYEKTLEYYFKALKINEELENKSGIANNLGNIGLVYDVQEDYPNALKYYFKSMEIQKELGEKSGVATNLGNIGIIYGRQSNYTDALEYFFKALKIEEELGDKNGIAINLGNIGYVYGLQSNYTKALEYYFKSLKIAKELGDRTGVQILYNNISDIYELQNNHAKALEYYKKHVALKDSIFNEESKTKIANLEAKRENELKQKEILILTKENQYKTNMTYVLFAISALILIILVVLYFFYKNKKNSHSALEAKNKIINDANIELEALNKDLNDKNRLISKSEQKLKEANASKDKFFNIIAHDLKNPLGSFKQLTALLLKDYNSFTTEERVEFIDLMNKSAQNLYELLENLLEWSRCQTDKIEYNPQKFDVSAILKNNVELLGQIASNKGVELSMDSPTNLFAYADVNMITTVIRNLASNAIKFTPGGEKVVLTARKKNDNIEISVIDTGVGISEKDQKKLFRLDVQHTTRGTSNEKGTGLGLILCKDFIEKNLGEIWVESETGKGSTFKFTIPKAK